MSGTIRITYRHISGCLHGDCPGHSALIRTVADVDTVIRKLAQDHADFPIEIEGVEDLPETVRRPAASP